MIGEGPHLHLVRVRIEPGMQFIDVPPGAVCHYAEAVSRHLHTVWHFPDAATQVRTVRLAFIPNGDERTRVFSPSFRHVITCRDGLGGYISLLEMTS